jgi:hypothetical protein
VLPVLDRLRASEAPRRTDLGHRARRRLRLAGGSACGRRVSGEEDPRGRIGHSIHVHVLNGLVDWIEHPTVEWDPDREPREMLSPEGQVVDRIRPLAASSANSSASPSRTRPGTRS